MVSSNAQALAGYTVYSHESHERAMAFARRLLRDEKRRLVIVGPVEENGRFLIGVRQRKVA